MSPVNLTLRQLDYLVAVAEHGTVTAASHALHLSQSTVSTAIADLERHLKVTLFVRHARGLTLTRDGESIVAEARRLLRDAENLQSHASMLGSQLTGALHIGCYTTIAPFLVPGAVAAFGERYAAVDVTFSEGSRHQLLDQLVQGRSDVAVMYAYRFGNQLSELGHTATRLSAVPPYVLLPPDHRLADAETVTLTELAEDPFILFDLEPGGTYFLSLFDEAGLTPRIRFRTQSSELTRCLVARGIGFALLSQRPRTTVSYEGLEYVTKELATRPEGLDVVAVTPGGSPPNRRVHAFIQVAREVLADHGTPDAATAAHSAEASAEPNVQTKFRSGG